MNDKTNLDELYSKIDFLESEDQDKVLGYLNRKMGLQSFSLPKFSGLNFVYNENSSNQQSIENSEVNKEFDDTNFLELYMQEIEKTKNLEKELDSQHSIQENKTADWSNDLKLINEKYLDLHKHLDVQNQEIVLLKNEVQSLHELNNYLKESIEQKNCDLDVLKNYQDQKQQELDKIYQLTRKLKRSWSDNKMDSEFGSPDIGLQSTLNEQDEQLLTNENIEKEAIEFFNTQLNSETSNRRSNFARNIGNFSEQGQKEVSDFGTSVNINKESFEDNKFSQYQLENKNDFELQIGPVDIDEENKFSISYKPENFESPNEIHIQAQNAATLENKLRSVSFDKKIDSLKGLQQGSMEIIEKLKNDLNYCLNQQGIQKISEGANLIEIFDLLKDKIVSIVKNDSLINLIDNLNCLEEINKNRKKELNRLKQRVEQFHTEQKQILQKCKESFLRIKENEEITIKNPLSVKDNLFEKKFKKLEDLNDDLKEKQTSCEEDEAQKRIAQIQETDKQNKKLEKRCKVLMEDKLELQKDIAKTSDERVQVRDKKIRKLEGDIEEVTQNNWGLNQKLLKIFYKDNSKAAQTSQLDKSQDKNDSKMFEKLIKETNNFEIENSQLKKENSELKIQLNSKTDQINSLEKALISLNCQKENLAKLNTDQNNLREEFMNSSTSVYNNSHPGSRQQSIIVKFPTEIKELDIQEGKEIEGSQASKDSTHNEKFEENILLFEKLNLEKENSLLKQKISEMRYIISLLSFEKQSKIVGYDILSDSKVDKKLLDSMCSDINLNYAGRRQSTDSRGEVTVKNSPDKSIIDNIPLNMSKADSRQLVRDNYDELESDNNQFTPVKGETRLAKESTLEPSPKKNSFFSFMREHQFDYSNNESYVESGVPRKQPMSNMTKSESTETQNSVQTTKLQQDIAAEEINYFGRTATAENKHLSNALVNQINRKSPAAIFTNLNISEQDMDNQIIDCLENDDYSPMRAFMKKRNLEYTTIEEQNHCSCIPKSQGTSGNTRLLKSNSIEEGIVPILKNKTVESLQAQGRCRLHTRKMTLDDFKNSVLKNDQKYAFPKQTDKDISKMNQVHSDLIDRTEFLFEENNNLKTQLDAYMVKFNYIDGLLIDILKNCQELKFYAIKCEQGRYQKRFTEMTNGFIEMQTLVGATSVNQVLPDNTYSNGFEILVEIINEMDCLIVEIKDSSPQKKKLIESYNIDGFEKELVKNAKAEYESDLKEFQMLSNMVSNSLIEKSFENSGDEYLLKILCKKQELFHEDIKN